jgi:GNAT superfamily N-acetyltransferase
VDQIGVVTLAPDLSVTAHFGADIAAVFEPLAALRVAVFRDFPYLYEGSLKYERAYLRTYADAPRAAVWAIWSDSQVVGATTCIPLADETEEVQRPFVAAGFSLNEVFYFGESLLLPAYRGRGLGHLFFEKREAHVAAFGTYACTAFCAVERPADHPFRPPTYRPLDDFWQKRGYVRQPDLRTTFAWPDLGATQSTDKSMVFWLKKLKKT